ncbi:MAG: hypothetical protein AAGM22_04095 [Acidobacteriota bacterium]
MTAADPPLYDAFLSYGSDPDRDLARDTEAYLEGLHRDPLIPEEHRKELQICVDGSDFVKPRRRGARAEDVDDPIFELLSGYLAKSAQLIVFVGPKVREHKWLSKELAWWIENRGPETVHLALTHGDRSLEDPLSWLPQPAVEAKLNEDLWFDFREARGPLPPGQSSRPFEEERLRLAASLVGPDLPASALIPGWRLRVERARRREAWRRAGLGLVVLLLLAFAGFLGRNWFESRAEARVGLWNALANVGSSLDPDRRADALSYGVAALRDRPSAEAYRSVAESLRVLAQPGPSYIVRGDGYSASDVLWLDDGRLVIGDAEGTLYLYGTRSSEAAASLKLGDSINGTVFLRGRSQLATLANGSVHLIEVTGGPEPRFEVIATTPPAPDLPQVPYYFAIDRDERTLVTASGWGHLLAFRLQEASADGWIPFAASSLPADTVVMGLAFAGDPETLVSVSITGGVRCHGFPGESSPTHTARQDFQNPVNIHGLGVHSTTREAVVLDALGGWTRFDATTCRPTGSVPPLAPLGSLIEDRRGRLLARQQGDAVRPGLSLSPDGQRIALVRPDASIRSHDALTGALDALAIADEAPMATAFSPDGRELAAVTAEGRLRSWRLDQGPELFQMLGIKDFAFGADGSFLLAIGVGDVGDDGAAGDDEVLLQIDLTETREAIEPWPLDRPTRLLESPEPGQDPAAFMQVGDRGWALLRFDGDGQREPRGFELEAGAPSSDAVHLHPLGGSMAKVGPRHLFRFNGGSPENFFESPAEIETIRVGRQLIGIGTAEGRLHLLSPTGGPVHMAPFAGSGILEVAGKSWLSGAGDDLCVCTLRIGAEASSSVVEGGACATTDARFCRRVPVDEGLEIAATSLDGQATALAASFRESDRLGDGRLMVASRSRGWKPRALDVPRPVDFDFSGDGQYLAVAYLRGILVWRVDGWSPVADLPTPNPVLKVRFSPDDALIASIDRSTPRVLRVWPWHPDTLADRACRWWPPDRAPPSTPGVAPIPPREALCPKA